MNRHKLLIVSLAALFIGAGIISLYFLLPTTPSSNNPLKNQTGIVLPLYEKSWKLSDDKAVIDWSPSDNIFTVGTDVYGADGTLRFSIATGTHTDFFSHERFSPDGSSIAYLYRAAYANYTIYSPLNQVQVFDIKSNTRQSIEFGANILDYDWGEDNNVIFYSTGLQIIRHDISTGDESIVVNSTSMASISQIDVSHDGKSLLFTEVISTTPASQCNDMFEQCFAIQLLVKPLATQENNTDSSSKITGDKQANASADSDDSTIIFQAERQVINAPRWAPDDSAVTFSKYPGFTVAGYPCGSIIEVSQDGQKSVTLFPGNEIYGKRACYNDNLVFNKDRSLLAYSKTLGYYPTSPDEFQPQNVGTYLTFSELCGENACKAPSKTIPIVKG